MRKDDTLFGVVRNLGAQPRVEVYRPARVVLFPACRRLWCDRCFTLFNLRAFAVSIELNAAFVITDIKAVPPSRTPASPQPSSLAAAVGGTEAASVQFMITQRMRAALEIKFRV